MHTIIVANRNLAQIGLAIFNQIDRPVFIFPEQCAGGHNQRVLVFPNDNLGFNLKTMAERNDWEAWINRDKAEIQRLSAEIAKCEDEINKQVYELFELTEDEIKLLEANI